MITYQDVQDVKQWARDALVAMDTLDTSGTMAGAPRRGLGGEDRLAVAFMEAVLTMLNRKGLLVEGIQGCSLLARESMASAWSD